MTDKSAHRMKHALLSAGVRIALAMVIMFPLLFAVDYLRGSFGQVAGLVGLVAAVLIGLYAVENLAAGILRRLSNHE